VGSTRLAGHGLAHEGGAFYADPAGRPRLKAHYGDRSRVGFGLCECGARSEELTSNYGRRKWHASHKRDMGSTAAP
jgi:hypothetical protein